MTQVAKLSVLVVQLCLELRQDYIPVKFPCLLNDSLNVFV